MRRERVNLTLIENGASTKISLKKRRGDLLKVNELSILCDVEVSAVREVLERFQNVDVEVSVAT